MKRKHRLKTDPAMYYATQRGAKNFEVRKDDRPLETRDIVILEYHKPPSAPVSFFDLCDPTTPPLHYEITFVLRGGQYGIEPGHVGLALMPLAIPDPKGDMEWKPE